jgi:hypothetical protein
MVNRFILFTIIWLLTKILLKNTFKNTGCVSESGDFATLFFLVRQHWGECRYRNFAANFKAF